MASPFVPTFAYEFNDPNPPQNFLPPVTFPYGASHASEIQYLFPQANPSGLGFNLPQTPLNPAQQQLSDPHGRLLDAVRTLTGCTGSERLQLTETAFG